MLKDFTDFYFEFEDNLVQGKYTTEQADAIYKESLSRYFKEDVNIEIPKEDPEGFEFYVKLLNTDAYPRKKFKLLAKKVTSLGVGSLTYTGQRDPIRYWVGPFETQKEALAVSKKLNSAGLKAKVERWTRQMFLKAQQEEEKKMQQSVDKSAPVQAPVQPVQQPVQQPQPQPQQPAEIQY